ncbi:D-alanyl-D-alanine endopeptidase [Thiomonas delicata]|nr:D-alanyl-D-alanine endopeptidase [Thiomonas delicata]
MMVACALFLLGACEALAASREQSATDSGATLRHDSAKRVVVRKHVLKRRAAPHPKIVTRRHKVRVASVSRRTSRHLPVKAARLPETQRVAREGNMSMDPIALRSGSALVVDEQSNQVLLSKNADDVRPIASLTKLMTAAVILDAHLPMDQIIEITDDDIDTLKWSSSRLRPGMKLSREELLKLALMSSENRAAHALARTYPGGMDAFMQAMNRKAAELGMTHTHYLDPTGLSPQNESTAHDLAILVKAVYAYPLIREFSTHPKSTVDVGNRELKYRNTDHLIFNSGWDILLQKTGYINEAGHCLVLNTVVQGRKVIVVLLDAWGKYSHFGDAERIRSWIERSGRTVLTRTESSSVDADSPARLVHSSVSE